MWVVCKQVGVFTHYLSASGKFLPGEDKANRFASQEMAKIMAKTHGGTVRQLNQS